MMMAWYKSSPELHWQIEDKMMKNARTKLSTSCFVGFLIFSEVEQNISIYNFHYFIFLLYLLFLFLVKTWKIKNIILWNRSSSQLSLFSCPRLWSCFKALLIQSSCSVSISPCFSHSWNLLTSWLIER